MNATKVRILFFAISIVFLFASCKDKTNTAAIISQRELNAPEPEDPFIEGNRKVVSLENEEIELFLKRYGWQATNTGSGLRIEIVKEGTGNFPIEGSTVTLKYKTILLSGEELYNSDKLGVKNFIVDKTDEITGLHEAVKLMKKGTKARLVIPPYLAYGVGGDGNKIKGRASIAMYVELIDVK